MCQKAEQTYVGVPCGIMDQFAVIMSKKDHAFLLDCRSLNYELISFPNKDVVILVINSNAHHNLDQSEYAERRKSCEQVAAMLAKSSLRDVSMKELETSRSVLQLDQYQYARHVITEIERTISASEALKKNDLVVFGALMTQSHYSLRDDYQVSCPEIDSLVEAALECECVYGSRMTGGGFGGCTVTLIKADKVFKAIDYIKSKCRFNPKFYILKAVDGAHYRKL
jgi:galactokinase